MSAQSPRRSRTSRTTASTAVGWRPQSTPTGRRRALASTRVAVGIDLGGNWIKCSLFAANTGELLERETMPTRDGQVEQDQPAFLAAILQYLRNSERKFGPAVAVGIAAPGLAARNNRCIDFMPGRLHGLEGLDWSAAAGRQVFCLNDAHAALMGENWLGAARGLQDVFMLTLGTGVGGAVISGGRLLQGHLGRAGHLGHLSLDVDGPPTITGCPGGLEWFVGNATIHERSGGRFSSTAQLTEAVASGDASAATLWDRSLTYLAAGIASLINVVDPEAVIIGGGIATVGALLFTPLEEKLSRVEWRPGGRRVRILPAALGEWAGSCGAAHFALQQAPDA